MTAYAVAPSRPTSWIARMLGWLSAATTRASRSKRASACAFGGEPLGEHLDRDVALQPGVARAIHLAHPAGADRGDHFVRTEPGAGREGHWGRADYRRASGLS